MKERLGMQEDLDRLPPFIIGFPLTGNKPQSTSLCGKEYAADSQRDDDHDEPKDDE
jgi:hypothetical protein